ncbi:MAG: class F sortase [Candidatus Dormibacteria bacterium]
MRRYISRRDMGILGAGTAALTAGAVVLLMAVLGPTGAAPRAADSGQGPSSPSSTPTAGPGSPSGIASGTTNGRCPTAPREPSKDFRLLIPRLAIDSHTEPVGVDAQGNVGTPNGKFCNVGWYSRGPAPGAPGNSVLDGHLDWEGAPAVFWRLGTLKPSDEVIVKRDGAVLHFKVENLSYVPYNAHPPGLFDTTGKPRLSLITCAGSFDFKHATYLQRLIVNASYVSRSA